MLRMSDVTSEQVAANLAHVYDRIGEAATRAGRASTDDVTLLAVSKTQPFALIEAALDAGQRDFGENRFEEMWRKVELGRELGLDEKLRWHFIGSIQSRKTTQAIGPFALVHSVDRVKIANRLARDAVAADCVLSVLLEVNVSGEASKHGFGPDELLAAMPALMQLPGLDIQGLMTMAPFVDDETVLRPVFRKTRELRDRIRDAHPSLALPQLSMGMSNDYELAIEEGATIVRVGSAIFGARAY